ncbi:AAA family ATPase [Thioalkalivibrio sulfidiphilus]|uniref:AAA family ATPase n=1 Tax=Thioalkalivibrio sulfidiphilus TaxID=1033854 RepID=UPI0003616E1D|nr:AAA family ATPase [Thioalkalivibrio sulfidiphilus]
MSAGRPIRAFRIGNFKAFADTQRIPLKPITLIFGPNSAGKSSFIHSLALAHEAQFGRDKPSLNGSGRRLDVHHTAVGGSAIDLGGFRQYVHRGQAHRRVEWGAELDVAAIEGRLAQLLAPVRSVTISIALGIALDQYDRPVPGAEPRVESIEIGGDGAELMRMSRRRTDGQGGTLRLDRLASDHAVFRQVLKAIVESATTSEEMRPEDFEGANAAIADLLPELQVRVDPFFPAAVELPKADGGELSPVSMLFPVSKGNRKDDIAQAVRFYLPRTLNDLIKGLAEMLANELKRLQYLGPLRSFPPRHLAFAEHEDANWYAGGGYAWDVVRRDDAVREAVNGWLGSGKLKTPYKLVVRSLVASDQLKEPLASGLDSIEDDDEAMFIGSVDKHGLIMEYFPIRDDARPFFRDVEDSAEKLVKVVDSSDIDRIRELVLFDQRTNTVVTHRDVGIGISQVLPVLVMAYGSQEKLLAMEQPEIHLHPALQAELGDVFIEAALGERGNTFILETHSEHLILRIMRRMRETYLKKETGLPPVTPEDVSVLYVEPDGARSIVREMPLNELGELVKSWPGGFFEEGLREQFGDA